MNNNYATCTQPVTYTCQNQVAFLQKADVMKTSRQSRIMEAVLSRLFGRFLQAVSLAFALLSFSSTQAETLMAPVAMEDEPRANAVDHNLMREDRSEFSGPFCQDTGHLENWTVLMAPEAAQPCAFLKAPGPLSAPFAENIESGVVHVRSGSMTLEADASRPIIEFATTDFQAGGNLAGVWETLSGVSQAGAAKSQNLAAAAPFTRVPEPCIAILSGVGLAVALFGRKRGRGGYER